MVVREAPVESRGNRVTKIDLNLKFVRSEAKIWRIYPGTKKDFLRQFIEDGCVFLEMPGLEIVTHETHPKATKKVRRSIMLPRVAMAKAMADWYLAADGERGSFPSTDPADYIDFNARSAGMAFANVERLFYSAKVGDIIIVPENDGFQSKLYIGEVTHPFSSSDCVKVRKFGAREVPVRKVRWLRLDFQRRLVSVPLSKELGGRRAVKPVSTDEFGFELFRLAYGNFAYKGEAQYVFEGEAYDDDPYSTVPGIELLTYAFAAANAILDGGPAAVSGLSFESLQNTVYRKQGLKQFEIAFASPGGYRAWHESFKALLLALALVSATGCDMTPQDAKAVELINSADENSAEYLKDLQAKYGDLIDSIPPAEFRRAKETHTGAKNGVDFTVQTKVKP